MPYAQRDGVRLYFEQGSQGEPELLFVPGWCCDVSLYAPQFEHFGASHAVTTVELRGCGRSDRPADGYDIPSLADDVAQVCSEAGIRKPVVIGHSLGGMIAVELAARHPGLPLAVVADDPGPIDPLPSSARIFDGFAALMTGPNGEDVRRAWVEEGVGPTANDAVRRQVVDTMCAVPLHVAAAVIRGVCEWNGVAALALCMVPTLVLRSMPGGSNAPDRLLALKPDLHFGVTVGAGHFHQLEVPEQVNAMIERFLAVAL
ncbi:MAG TPA: alpha/beta hydrolase [Gaiellaceae bacterium]